MERHHSQTPAPLWSEIINGPMTTSAEQKITRYHVCMKKGSLPAFEKSIQRAITTYRAMIDVDAVAACIPHDFRSPAATCAQQLLSCVNYLQTTDGRQNVWQQEQGLYPNIQKEMLGSLESNLALCSALAHHMTHDNEDRTCAPALARVLLASLSGFHSKNLNTPTSIPLCRLMSILPEQTYHDHADALLGYAALHIDQMRSFYEQVTPRQMPIGALLGPDRLHDLIALHLTAQINSNLLAEKNHIPLHPDFHACHRLIDQSLSYDNPPISLQVTSRKHAMTHLRADSEFPTCDNHKDPHNAIVKKIVFMHAFQCFDYSPHLLAGLTHQMMTPDHHVMHNAMSVAALQDGMRDYMGTPQYPDFPYLDSTWTARLFTMFSALNPPRASFEMGIERDLPPSLPFETDQHNPLTTIAHESLADRDSDSDRRRHRNPYTSVIIGSIINSMGSGDLIDLLQKIPDQSMSIDSMTLSDLENRISTSIHLPPAPHHLHRYAYDAHTVESNKALLLKKLHPIQARDYILSAMNTVYHERSFVSGDSWETYQSSPQVVRDALEKNPHAYYRHQCVRGVATLDLDRQRAPPVCYALFLSGESHRGLLWHAILKQPGSVDEESPRNPVSPELGLLIALQLVRGVSLPVLHADPDHGISHNQDVTIDHPLPLRKWAEKTMTLAMYTCVENDENPLISAYTQTFRAHTGAERQRIINAYPALAKAYEKLDNP